jgi:hypothetical protein
MSKRHRVGRQETLHEALGTEPATSARERLGRTVTKIGSNALEVATARVEAGDWVGAIHAASAAQAAADVTTRRAVRLARDQGVTWQAIADGLGLASKQTAHARYGTL